jgi:hypothetical protein
MRTCRSFGPDCRQPPFGSAIAPPQGKSHSRPACRTTVFFQSDVAGRHETKLARPKVTNRGRRFWTKSLAGANDLTIGTLFVRDLLREAQIIVFHTDCSPHQP